VLEEAAGISGLYQRRHEAELKLTATEANLTRIDDVLDQLAQHLAQLARQARQAARYREIGQQLRRAEGMLLYRRWREADEARARAEEALRDRTLDTARTEAAARAADTLRAAAETGLPPLREEEAIAGAILQRLQVQRDALTDQETNARQTIQTLTARIDQLGRDIDRETGLNRDAGDTIDRLDWEARELAKAGAGHSDRLAEAADLAQEAATVLQDREAHLSQVTEDVARLAARHQSAQRLLDDSRKTLERSETEEARAADAVEVAKTTLADAAIAYQAAGEAEEEAQAMTEAAEEALALADEARTDTQARESEARAQRSEAEGEAGALRAEVGALARLLARDTTESGQVMDLMKVAPGFEKALGAALADDLRAPMVDEDGPSGWADMAAYPTDQPLPDGTEPLARHVTGPSRLARRIAQIGLIDSDAGPMLQPLLRPGQRLVSIDGDLWRWDGFRAWAEDAPSAAALRLEQINRLETLKQDLARVDARADGARAAHEHLGRLLAEVTEADRIARQARRDADQKLAACARALSRAEADRTLAQGRLETLTLAVDRHREDAMAARLQLREAEAGIAGLGDLGSARAAVEDIKHMVEAARITMLTRRSAHDEIRREGEARTRRSQEVTKEVSGWRHRLETAGKRITELTERKAASEDDLEQAQTVPAEIAARREDLTQAIATAEIRRTNATDRLAAAEATLRDALQAERDAARLASEAREARAGALARLDAARETATQTTERIAEDSQSTPNQLLNRLDVDPGSIPSADTLEAEVNLHKRQRDALGAVNLRAEEDAREVQTEHDTLQGEKTDLVEAIRTLRSGIASLNREGRERLLTAFEQVNSNFTLLFRHLFGGGEASLVMVESDDPLEAGLEIMCQPPGKKLSTLSLLSGGEQTLTALALIFAVFLANPAPICVLDEVDAPLDDANVTRFCDLLDEMCRRTDTRFLTITHHAVTMARMDRLFGVTMAEQGVSQLVSVDLRKAAAMVA
jgi:chromosome segregation protein